MVVQTRRVREQAREPIYVAWLSRHEERERESDSQRERAHRLSLVVKTRSDYRGQSKRMMGKERKGVSKIEAKQDRESKKKTFSEK